MGKHTGIEWTEHTFNGVIGCTKVSEACKHCYAETDHPTRVSRSQGIELWGPQAERRSASEAMWHQLYTWGRQAHRDQEYRRVFCYSLGDVFEDNSRQLLNHKGQPLYYAMQYNELTGEDIVFTTMNTGTVVTCSVVRRRLYQAIKNNTSLIFLLLTKRPQNASTMMVPIVWNDHSWPHNVWLGTTTENQERYDERIEHLMKTGARTKFISAEPLLGPLDLRQHKPDWVIAGGESRRPGFEKEASIMRREWVTDLRDQCEERDIPFFFKQWGDWIPDSELTDQTIPPDAITTIPPGDHATPSTEFYTCLGKKRTGSLLGGRHYKQDPLSHLIDKALR